MKSKTLGIAVVAAIGVFSTSAFAVSPYGNGTQKGSLLVFPKIDITAGRDTFIQITNDYSGPVTLKCYYQTSEPGANYRIKHKTDFTVNLTKNQTTWWYASNGAAGSGFFRQGVPQFSPMADGYNATAGELKCWAVTENLSAEIHFNHLVGTATVVDGGKAFTYNAYSFQALTPGQGSVNTGAVLPTPGVLSLNNVKYDSCPLQAIGNAFATTGPYPATIFSGQVDLVQCNQDLRETYTPPVTKYVFEFWSENENKFTGTEVCGDSWIEKDLWDLQESRFANLKTTASYFRVSGVGQICVGGKDGGVYGVMSQRWPNGALTGSTLNGRGNFNGQILYDTGPF
jgi:hypothetical protein